MSTTPRLHLKKGLITWLNPQLKEMGFHGGDIYWRRRDRICDKFQLIYLDAKPGYYIEPNVAVRIEQVEEIFHRTSEFEPKYHKGTATVGNSVGVLTGGRSGRACQFLLTSEDEIAPTANKIMRVFREYALPYYERWSSLSAIDAELNDRPTERTIHKGGPDRFRCSTGIIVARLVGRPNYDELVKTYTEVMTRPVNASGLKWFVPLLRSLESVKPGSASPA